MSRNILIDPQRTGTGNPSIQFSGSSANLLKLDVLPNGSVQFSGTLGQIVSFTDTITGSIFGNNVYVSGTIIAASGITGSITKLSDGTSFITAGANVTVITQSNGSIVIASTATGTGTGGGDTFFYSTITGSLYTTGSTGFIGNDPIGATDSPSKKGTDVFFYVSGSRSTSKSLFGGSVHSSGTLSVYANPAGVTDSETYLSGQTLSFPNRSNNYITVDGRSGSIGTGGWLWINAGDAGQGAPNASGGHLLLNAGNKNSTGDPGSIIFGVQMRRRETYS